MDQKPFITIVVPAFNEEFSLPASLCALKEQTYKGGYEILVVDNASTDRTAQVAAAAGCRVVYEAQPGYVYAVRAGFEAAQGEIIACTDADTLVPKTWLEQMAATLLRPGVAGVSGSITFCDGPWWLRFFGSIIGRLNWHLAGANMAIWKWAYFKSGGFRPSQINMGADVELGFRIKKLGSLVIDRSLCVATSARRFQLNFWGSLVLYYCNDLSLVLFKKPLFYRFANYRLNARTAATTIVPFSRIAFPLLILMFLLYLTQTPESQLMGSVFAHSSREQSPVVALTFDDEPGDQTAAVLDILRKRQVRATFFVVGAKAQHNGDLLMQMVRDGHEIGNNSFSHPLYSAIESPVRLGKELDQCAKVIRSETGVTPLLFRPPQGWRTPWMISECRNKGYTVVTWSVDIADWLAPNSRFTAERILQKVEPGAIIQLHDNSLFASTPKKHVTLDALPDVIDELKNRGYLFVTVSELMASSQYRPDRMIETPEWITAMIDRATAFGDTIKKAVLLNLTANTVQETE